MVFDMTVHGCGHDPTVSAVGYPLVASLKVGLGENHVSLRCLFGVVGFASLLLNRMLLPPIPVYASGEPGSLSLRAIPRPIWRDVVVYASVLGVRGSTDSEHRKHASQGESFVGESFSFPRYEMTPLWHRLREGEWVFRT